MNSSSSKLLSVFLFASVASCSSMAMSDESYSSSTDQEPKSVWRISPRVFYSMFNANNKYSESGTTNSRSQSSVMMPQYGVTVDYIPASSLYSYALSVYSGVGGDGTFHDVNGGNYWNGDVDWNRIDTEFLVKKRLEGSDVYLVAGARYLRLESEWTIKNTNAGAFFTDTNKRNLIYESNIYLAEFGVGAAHAMDDAGKHALFGNGLMALGYAKQEKPLNITSNGGYSGVYGAGDINGGYAYKLTDNTSVSARYRVTFLPDFDGDGKVTLVPVHGPELGVSYSF